jgi:hypothetical protein
LDFPNYEATTLDLTQFNGLYICELTAYASGQDIWPITPQRLYRIKAFINQYTFIVGQMVRWRTLVMVERAGKGLLVTKFTTKISIPHRVNIARNLYELRVHHAGSGASASVRPYRVEVIFRPDCRKTEGQEQVH